MRLFLKAFSLVLAFSVDVQVHAETTLSSAGTAAQLNHSNQLLIKEVQKGSVVAYPKAVFINEFANDQIEISWVRGQGAIQGMSGVKVKSQFGESRCQSTCLGVFSQEIDTFTFHALMGEWEVSGFTRTESFHLSPGASIALSLVKDDGKTGFSQPFSISKNKLDQLVDLDLAPLLDKNQKELIYQNWKKELGLLSKLYQDRASRSVASADAKKRQIKAARQAAEKEERFLKDLFKQKTLLD